ncbi:YadA-like family protein [Psychrobacter sp. HD31]|uniref:YadA family autotransporter adhesin n=1 Tax=Psychrobacter sp. HD31 TaxID=3112003 RepID=UPI003DA21B7A
MITEVKTLDQDDNVANFKTGDNIVLTDDSGSIKIATADEVEFTKVTVGPVVTTATGIDMGSQKITNLAAGTAGTDAVNVDQLKQYSSAATTEVVSNGNTSVTKETGSNGQTIYQVAAEDTTVSVGDGLTVTPTLTDSTDGDAGVDDYKVELSQDTQDSLDKADSALQEIVTQIDGTEVKTLDQDDNVANFKTGDNIVLTDDSGSIKIATADEVEFTKVTVGPVVTTATGIDMGSQKITNLAAGTAGTDAVNVDQLKQYSSAATTEVVSNGNTSVTKETGSNGQTIYQVAAEDTTVSVGDGLTVTPTLTDSTDGDAGVDDYKVELSQDTQDSLDKADSALQEIVTQIDGTEVKMLDQDDNVANFKTGDNIVLTDDSGSIKIATAKDVSFDSVQITDGATLNADGIDMASDKITNLAAGTEDTDAVNVSQLKEVSEIANKSFTVSAKEGAKDTIGKDENIDFSTDSNLTVEYDAENNQFTHGLANIITVGDTTDQTKNPITINGDTGTITGLTNNITTNIDDTTQEVSPKPTYVSGSAATIDDVLNAGWNLQGNGDAKDYVRAFDTVNFADGSATTAVVSTDSSTNTSKVVYNVNVDNDTIKIVDNKLEVNTDAIAGQTSLTYKSNTDDGTKKTVSLSDGLDFTNGANGNITASVDDDGKVQHTLNKDINLDSVTTGDTVMNADGITISNGNSGSSISLTKDGLDNGGNKITNVAKGTADTDAVNVSQLKSSVAAAKTEVTAGTNIASVDKTTGDNDQTIYTINAKGASASAGSSYVTVNSSDAGDNVTDYKVDVAQNVKDATEKALNEGLTFTGDSGSTNEELLGSTVAVTGDSNITTKASGNEINVSLNDDISVNSVKANNVNVADELSVTKGANINMGGNQIHNVGAGEAPDDAVNVSQLNDLGNKLDNKIGSVAEDSNAGISSAMAQAAIPQAYIPGKTMLAGGIATYNGEGAAAIGVSKLSDNGRWVIKLSGSADTQGNAGASAGIGMHF